MQVYLQKYNLFPKKSLCWGKIIEILLNRDFVFSIFKPRKFFYKEEFFWRNRGNSLFSSHSSHGFLGRVLATVLLLCLVEAIGEAELHASGVFPLLLLEPHVAVGTVGFSAYGVEDVAHVQT